MIDKSDNAGGKSKRKAPTKKPAKSAAAQGKPKAGTAPKAKTVKPEAEASKPTSTPITPTLKPVETQILSTPSAEPPPSRPAFTLAPDYRIKRRPGPNKLASAAEINARYPLTQEALLAALPHPIFVIAHDNQFIFANSAAESFFSTSEAMLRRVRLDDLLGFGCPLIALAEQVRETGSTLNEYEVEVVTPRFSGPKLVDVYGGPIIEVPDAVVLMLQQRSMAHMIERQLTHRAAARSVSGMAAVLAHEIKNPLSGIRGAAQLLEQNLSDADRALSQLICAETDRIRKLVDRMEVFGDERPLVKEPINIHDVLDHVRRLSENGFAKGITFVEDYDPSLPPVPGKRDTLIQALLNLVKNAAEAIRDREHGRISIQTAYRPGVRLSVPGTETRVALPLMIQIEDNGPGVPEYLRPHLFDPFVTTKPQGTGLGLALVAKIIGDHGGVIECDSEPNRTIFRILLPTHDQPRLGKPG
ncbi:Nitrogen regulation protein NtrB (modular protein) [Candidatus Filomicrobium marinum]|uniref:histidine kinase n=1 Tax=Candidatus Filomicrobium marinum TaxID=1608628 RepID=A0A0D6JIA0_9HYPH|nr:ATP-binding protein [Candidatus Filomicrobium marinum]CFX37766.1 Nitrogen regulation protein NtrB (modular protein) [Candidatus Filomicrobium marinum]CPR21590.1 Nitrogen regulation protein NtrB (modular protein) [Candidatus Filomicrobium marinum]